MCRYLSLLLFIPFVSFGQDKFQPGNTNFNSLDRIAINDVIDAYGLYWDNNDLEAYLSLFSDDAIGVTYRQNGERVEVRIKDEYIWK